MDRKIVFGVMLTLLLTSVLVSISFISLSRTQPLEGDWIVTGAEVVENKTVELNGNLIVVGGGSLTLINVTLVMKSSYKDEYGILAESGSFLVIYNSTIMPANDNYTFTFTVRGAEFVMEYSKVRGVGGAPDQGLLIEDANNAIIKGNTIYHKDVTGVYIHRSQNASIANNVFTGRHRWFGIALVDSHNCTAIDNHLYNQSEAIFVQRTWDSHVVHNNIDSSFMGIVLRHGPGNNVIANNTVSACTHAGLWLDHTPFPNMFANNTIKHIGRFGCILSFASNAIVANNSFADFEVNWGENDALCTYNSYSNFIGNNHINGSSNGIISLSSQNNTVGGNVVLNSEKAINLHYSSDNNTVTENMFANNSMNIILDYSHNNTIRMNNFITFQRQGYDNGQNLWSYNYWSDYTGEDNDDDGIGDTPYNIPPQGLDPEPLVKPLPAKGMPVPTLKPAAYETTVGAHLSIESNTIWEDQFVEFTGRFVVEEGASLTLRNVTLATNPYKIPAAENWLTVRSGAALYIYESRILGAERNSSAAIKAERGSIVVVKDSLIRNLYTGESALDIGTDGAIIENNVFERNFAAISVMGSSHCRIVNNTISESYIGIDIAGENNTVANNKVSKTVRYGIRGGSHVVGNIVSDVWGNAVFCFGNSLIENNTIADVKGRAISVEWGGNIFVENTIKDAWVGIALKNSGNLLYHNNFVNNTVQVYSYDSANTWDEGYPSGGNYWSDYIDVDQYSGPNQDQPGSDGVWDHPYVIDENNVDHYPLVPEFPTWTSMLLILIALTVAITVHKRQFKNIEKELEESSFIHTYVFFIITSCTEDSRRDLLYT